jgi:hypothetical protein
LIQILGVVQVVPQAIKIDSGELAVGEEKSPAVILKFVSDETETQVIIPTSDIDQFIQNLQLVANSKIQIATDMSQAEKLVNG